MPTISTARGRFFYRQAAGNEPVLVFLHGNLGTSRWWRPVLDLLPPGWLGVAYDAIGYGYSERTERLDRFGVGAQMLDLDAFLTALALEPVHLISHSSATPAAISFALSYPRRLASLVLVDPVPATGITTPPEAYPLLERMPQDRQLLQQALIASMPTLDQTSPFFQQLLDDAAEISPLALVAGARSLDAWRPGEKLRQLTLPVLLMRGQHDIMLSEADAHQTLLAIPGANNLESLQGVGHSPMVEAPAAFADVLVRYISEDQETFAAVRESTG